MPIHEQNQSPETPEHSLSQEELPSLEIPQLDPDKKTFIIPIPADTQGITFQTEGVDHDEKHFDPKSELHVTVIGFKTAGILKKAFNQDETLESTVNELIAQTDWTMSVQEEQLHLSKPQTINIKGGGQEVRERESIIQLVDVPELNDFYEKLNTLLGTSIEAPPPHITLYTYKDPMGIGVNTQLDLDSCNPTSVHY